MLNGSGNGLLSAAVSALQQHYGRAIAIEDYHEHTLGKRSDSRSVAYICCTDANGKRAWGVGIDSDVTRASLQALLNAANAFLPAESSPPVKRPARGETSR
jgi:2-isopropylmalate synthase